MSIAAWDSTGLALLRLGSARHPFNQNAKMFVIYIVITFTVRWVIKLVRFRYRYLSYAYMLFVEGHHAVWLSKNWIIIKKDNINISQGKLIVKTDKLTKARENAGDQTTFGPPFTFDWLRGWRQFLDQTQSEVKQRQSNPGLLSRFQQIFD